MAPSALALFLAIALVAAYVQTLTGFALGLILMGGVGLTGIMSLPDAAVVVSFLVLVNAAQVLLRGWRDVARRELVLVILASLPALAAGYLLLGILSGARADWLRLVLGIVIVLSALQLLRSRSRRQTPSSAWSMLSFGAMGGVMSGLFSAAGPPLVFQMYRQPLPAAAIRETLVTIFALNAVFRLSMVAAGGALSPASLSTALVATPVVIGATAAARRWPPPLSPAAMRVVVFVLLALSGLSLAGPAALKLTGVS